MRHTLRFIVAIILSTLLRLIPFRPANFEPIMGTMMPFAQRFGWFGSALYTFVAMVGYDLLTNYGPWTWTTAITYTVISMAAGFYFKRFPANRTHFVIFGVAGVLFFDALTGPILPWLLNDRNLYALTMAQIPFTISHLAGTIVFALVASPIIHKYLVMHPFWDLQPEKELATQTKKSAA